VRYLLLKLKKFDEKKRFIFVGSFGTILTWLTYNVIYITLYPNTTLAWLFSYIFGVAQQHLLHRNFTFLTTSKPFFPELVKSYFAYSLGLLISSICYYYLINMMLMDHQISWILSTGVSVVCNYISLKIFVFNA